MSRYHINPKTGNANLCKAAKACPFGDLEKDHFSSASDARNAYEHVMNSGGKWTTSLASKPRQPVANWPERLKKLHVDSSTSANGVWIKRTKFGYNVGAARDNSSLTSFSGQTLEQASLSAALMENGEKELSKRQKEDLHRQLADVLTPANGNMDEVHWANADEMWDALSRAEQQAVMHNDTVVRDWYFEGRDKGLNHEAALRFALQFDEESAKFDWETPPMDYRNTYANLLKEFLKGNG